MIEQRLRQLKLLVSCLNDDPDKINIEQLDDVQYFLEKTKELLIRRKMGGHE